MKRQTYHVTLTDSHGRLVGQTVAYAMNSGIRASEQLAREYARAEHTVLEGFQPERSDMTYVREWVTPCGGRLLTALVDGTGA